MTAETMRTPAPRRAGLTAATAAAVAACVYVALPALAGLGDTLERLRDGDPSWLALGVLLELASYAAYVLLFRAVFGSGGIRIDWMLSARITLAGVVASRLFAAGGAGGVVLTAWALRRAGMGRGEVAERITAFLVLLYGVYMAALIVGGTGLRSGILAGPDPVPLTVVPAMLGSAVVALALAMACFPAHVQRRVPRWASPAARAGAHVGGGVRGALVQLRRGDARLLGAVGWWAFDIAVLWSCFRAFGDAPPVAVLVMGYFVGMLANLLPVPGGLGGVEGGMIGAFVGFGVAPSLAVLAVLGYRAIAFWMPMLPGIVAYLQLTRRFGSWRGPEAPAAPWGSGFGRTAQPTTGIRTDARRPTR